LVLCASFFKQVWIVHNHIVDDNVQII